MGQKLLIATVFLVVFAAFFWLALIRTVHQGTLAVPNLTGASLEEAQKLAHDRGLLVEVISPGVFSSSVPPGTIGAQEPPPGFHVKSGSTVSVRLSLGSEQVAVPVLAGDSLQAAISLLDGEGLHPGRRVTVRGQAAADSVLASRPGPGTRVAPGSDVDLLLNIAPRQHLWVTPSFLSASLNRVTDFCRRHRFRIGQIHRVAYPGLAPGTVLRQYPPAGSPFSRSDIIALWVSR